MAYKTYNKINTGELVEATEYELNVPEGAFIAKSGEFLGLNFNSTTFFDASTGLKVPYLFDCGYLIRKKILGEYKYSTARKEWFEDNFKFCGKYFYSSKAADDCSNDNRKICEQLIKTELRDLNKIMTFNEAFEKAVNGYAIYSEIILEENEFIYYVPGGNYHPQTTIIKKYFSNHMVKYRPYLALKTAQEDVIAWNPSTSAIFADDWKIKEIN